MDERFAVNVEALRGVQPQWISIEEIDLVPGVNVSDASDYGAVRPRGVRPVEAALRRPGTPGSCITRQPVRSPPRSASDSDDGPQALGAARGDDEPEAGRDSLPERREEDGAGPSPDGGSETEVRPDHCGDLDSGFCRTRGYCTRVERQWNHSFNQMVEPDFSTIGASLALPGLSDAFTPHPHQRDGVARMLHSPATLANHVVGAGKTGTMVMAAMELRRTGRSSETPGRGAEPPGWTHYARSKPVATPPHGSCRSRTGQNPSERQTWMARSAGQDWDMVVCPQSTFKLMGVAPALAHAWTEARAGRAPRRQERARGR